MDKTSQSATHATNSSNSPSTVQAIDASPNQNNQIIQFNPASQLPIKLMGSGNFSTQGYALMCGYDLVDYLDGTIVIPPKTIRKDNQDDPNPEYRIWFRQDSMIHNALMASVGPTIAPSIATAANSKEAWDHLHITYANKSQAHMYSLRDILGKVSRDHKKITEYLHDVRSIANEFATGWSTYQ